MGFISVEKSCVWSFQDEMAAVSCVLPDSCSSCQLPGCLFVDVDTLPENAYGMIQLLFLMAAYGTVLFYGANMIGDGAEDLLKLDAWKPIVGPIVLPVLGAVPDAAIVFFSGMGPGAQVRACTAPRVLRRRA
eukprot:SAG22_NODE_259_length_13477_cov_10.020407_14_plen_132_part_00